MITESDELHMLYEGAIRLVAAGYSPDSAAKAAARTLKACVADQQAELKQQREASRR